MLIEIKYIGGYEMKKEVKCLDAPAAIGPYSQAIELGGMIFVSGQLGMTTDKAFGESVTEQARQSLNNLKSILETAGYSMSDVIKTTIFLADIDDFKDVNTVYGEFFTPPYPARSTVSVKALPLNAKVEIEVIANK